MYIGDEAAQEDDKIQGNGIERKELIVVVWLTYTDGDRDCGTLKVLGS